MRRGKNKRRNKDKARWATAGGTWKRREKERGTARDNVHHSERTLG
jgi:hypothetical protein